MSKAVSVIGQVAGGPLGFIGGKALDMNAKAGDEAARTQGEIAQARAAKAEEQRQEAIRTSMPTTAELVALDAQHKETERAIMRQEKILASVDPALIEAGSQALKLLRGQEAQIIAPMRAEQDRQRAKLANDIQKQLGPGGLNSTAGQEALNRFDQNAQLTIAQAQQKSLSDLMGTVERSGAGAFQGAGGQAYGSELGARNAIQSRQLSAMLGAPTQAFAGAPFAEALSRTQAQQAQTSQLLSLGGTLGGAAIGGIGGAKAGSTAAETLAPATTPEPAQTLGNVASSRTNNYSLGADTNFGKPAF